MTPLPSYLELAPRWQLLFFSLHHMNSLGTTVEFKRWGWVLDHLLEPHWAALNPLFSLCSVLDDEGSNLRQQKLDRQVSEAAADGKAERISALV